MTRSACSIATTIERRVDEFVAERRRGDGGPGLAS